MEYLGFSTDKLARSIIFSNVDEARMFIVYICIPRGKSFRGKLFLVHILHQYTETLNAKRFTNRVKDFQSNMSWVKPRYIENMPLTLKIRG